MRTVAHYESDSRRNLKGRSQKWLKGYIGREVIHILVADDLVTQAVGSGILTPSVRSAISVLKDLVKESGE